MGEGRGGEEVVAQPLSKAVMTNSHFVRWIVGLVQLSVTMSCYFRRTCGFDQQKMCNDQEPF